MPTPRAQHDRHRSRGGHINSLKDLRIPALVLKKNKIIKKIYFDDKFS
jgi:hypothetical protein